VNVTPDGTVPPGASPLVSLHVDGGADRVTVQSGGVEMPLPGGGPDWTFRLPIPESAEDAWPFTVRVTRGADEIERQVIVPLAAGPLASVTLSPVRAPAGSPVGVTATVLAQASVVTLSGPNLNTVLSTGSGLEWTGAFTVPAGWTGRTALTLTVVTAGVTFTVPVVFLAH
ncbi:MAG TPA: hypothetical protein VHN99_11945, partial [Deinococcales bacterium]|nr:hypothetical protein [Deinococcales bacterium]